MPALIRFRSIPVSYSHRYPRRSACRTALEFDLGLLLEIAHERSMIGVAQAVHFEGLHNLPHGGGERQGRAELVTGIAVSLAALRQPSASSKTTD